MLVRYDNPLKQGLKHLLGVVRDDVGDVRYDNPLKQGLKLEGPIVLAERDVSDMTIH